MSYVTWKIEHIPFNNGWDTDDTETIAEFYDPIVRVSIGKGLDKFEFKTINFNSTLNDKFNPNDKITIYRVVNSESFASTDIMMVGSVKDTPDDFAGTTNMLRVEGANYSEVIANAITFVDVTGLTIDAALKLAVDSASDTNPNFKVTWATTNPTTKKDGITPLPTIQGSSLYFNKPLKDVLEKYSTTQETGDGDYFWYVNNNNELIWQPKSSTINHSFNATTDDYKKLKIAKDLSDVKNYLILKGGLDPEGNQIQTKYVNWSSVATNGTKYLFVISETTQARNLIQSDLRLSYGDNIGANKYPTFPFTTTWTWGGSTGTVEGVSVTQGTKIYVTDSTEYVAVLRAEIKRQLSAEGKKIADVLGYGKLKLDITFRAGQVTWGLGSNIRCTIPSIQSVPFTLRVSDIQYTTTTDTYSLEEDKGTIGR